MSQDNSYKGVPRHAGDDAITKPSQRVLRARDGLVNATAERISAMPDPIPEPVLADAPSSKPMDRAANRAVFVYAHLTSPMTKAELAEASSLSASTIDRSLRDLMDDGRVMCADGRYTRVKGREFPKEMMDAAVRPVRGNFGQSSDGQPRPRAKAKRARVDVLASMAGSKSISSDSLPSYRRAFEDVSRLHYGVKEIDDALTALKEVLRGRLASVEYACPLCVRPIEVKGTACRCKRCGWSIDVGDVQGALELAKFCKRKE